MQKSPFLKPFFKTNATVFRNDGHTLLYAIKCPHCDDEFTFPEIKQLVDWWDGMNINCPLCSELLILMKARPTKGKTLARSNGHVEGY